MDIKDYKSIQGIGVGMLITLFLALLLSSLGPVMIYIVVSIAMIFEVMGLVGEHIELKKNGFKSIV